MIICLQTPVFLQNDKIEVDSSPTKFQTSSTFIRDVKQLLRQHNFDRNSPELGFTGLTSGQRRLLHRIADDYGLLHFSRNNYSGERIIFLAKRSYLSEPVMIFVRDYVCLEGEAIEACTSDYLEAVPEKWILARMKRDGINLHHMTLLSKHEVHQLELSDDLSCIEEGSQARRNAFTSKFMAICRDVALEVPLNNWSNEGLGSVHKQGNKAIFLIVSWPFGNLVRSRLNLDPADFHITLGFYPNDVNEGSRKDLSSRIEKVEDIL